MNPPKSVNPAASPRRARAFTLIELLTVVAIIGVLAAILVASIGGALRKAKVTRVQAELEKLVTAINDYKAAVGSFPPDNPANPASPPLYYELTGMVSTDGTSYTTRDGRDTLLPAQVSANFGIGGFFNSAPNTASAKNFLPKLDAKQHRQFNGVELLVAPVPGTNAFDPAINPWRYVSRNPTNNPRTFDLWAEVVIGGRTLIIGNWK